MLKVVVFGGGWGGELVANYLAEEISIIDIVRVIDWKNAPYDNKTLPEICELAAKHLRRYIGQVDLIILGGYVVSLAQSYLEKCYPSQKFVGMGINYYRILKARNYPSQITIFMDSHLTRTTIGQEVYHNFPHSTISFPDCTGWEALINLGEMSKEVLRLELQDDFVLHQKPARHTSAHRAQSKKSMSLLETIRQEKAQQRRPGETLSPTLARFNERPPTPTNKELIQPDVVLLLSTHLWDIKSDLEELFGYRVRVLDFRQKLLHDTCAALGLRGVDGQRSK